MAKADLVGEKSVVMVTMLHKEVPALVDTGSMISIIAVAILAHRKMGTT